MQYNLAITLASMRDYGLPGPEIEYRFHPSRRWRFDLAWPDYLIALEVEGGVWTAGRHTRPAGFLKDMEKYNMAAVLGWRVLRCTPEQLPTLQMTKLIKSALDWAQLRSEMNLWAGATVNERIGSQGTCHRGPLKHRNKNPQKKENTG